MKIRTYLQLLKLLKKHLLTRKKIYFGLCNEIDELCRRNVFSGPEHQKLINIFLINPNRRVIKKLSGNPDNIYYWVKGDIKLRIKWVNALIKKYSKKRK